MSYLKNFLFLACCFLIGMGIATAILKYRASRTDTSETTTGVGSAPPVRGFYVSLDAASGEITRFKPLHATAVAISYTTSAGPTALHDAVAKAHKLGLKVILLPPAVFSKTDPYPMSLPAMGAAAQSAKVDYLCVSWLDEDSDGAYWTLQASALRKVFKGKLILAATPNSLVGIDFTSAVDCIAAIGPIEIPQRLPHAPDDVDLHTLRMAWATRLDEFESLSRKLGKPLFLLNMGIPATIRSKLPLPGVAPAAPTPDPALQAMSYEALLLETKGRHATEGLFLPLAPDPTASAATMPRIEALWSEDKPDAISAQPPVPVTVPTTEADEDDTTGAL